MGTGGGQPQDHVAGAGFRAIDDGILLHHADAEARQVVVSAVIHAGHFGGLSADQSASGLDTPIDDAGNDALGDIDVEFAAGKIIQKEQRFGALHDHVIGAHGNQIDAHAVVAVRVDRQPKFGADPVGSRYQYRLAIPVQGHFDQSAKAADAAQHFRTHRALYPRFDSLDQFVAGVDIDPGVAIGYRRSLNHLTDPSCRT